MTEKQKGGLYVSNLVVYTSRHPRPGEEEDRRKGRGETRDEDGTVYTQVKDTEEQSLVRTDFLVSGRRQNKRTK